MAKVLSIEIGNSITKIAEVELKAKKAKIYNSFVIPTIKDVITPEGEVAVVPTFITMIEKELQERKIGTKNVVFVVNSQRVVSRDIVIPYLKEARVHDFVIQNQADYFPYSLSGYEVSCDIGDAFEDNGVKKLHVTVNCMPAVIVRAYEQLAEALNFNLVGLDHAGNAIKKMMLAEIPEELKITFKMEENSTIITIVKDDQVQFQRTANYGVDEILDEIKKTDLFGSNLTDIDALEIVERKTMVFKHLSDTTIDEVETEVDSAKLMQLRSDITSNLEPLIGNLTKILDMYIRDKENITLNDIKVYLVGLGSVCSGLGKLLSNELGVKVVASQSFAPQVTGEKVDPSRFAEYFACCGCAIDPIAIVFEDKWHDKKSGKAGGKKNGGKQATYTESLTSAILISGVLVIAAVALFVYSMLTHAALRAENQRLTSEVARLEYIEEIVATYNATSADYQWALNVDKASSSYNDNLVAVINELEQKMPAEIKVLTLSANESSILLNVEVSSKSVAADVIRQLRTFDSFVVGNVSTITDTEDESGKSTVSFSLECTYVEQTAETAEQPVAQ